MVRVHLRVSDLQRESGLGAGGGQAALSGPAVSKISEVEQFQVMTRGRVWPQEWEPKDTKERALAGEELQGQREDSVPGDTQATVSSAGGKYCTKVRCPSFLGGEGVAR